MNRKGCLTGLKDSNGKPIKDGDTIVYEYKIGLNKDTNDEIYSRQVSDAKLGRHETVMQYQIKSNCAGYFLDIPHNALADSLVYTVAPVIDNDLVAPVINNDLVVPVINNDLVAPVINNDLVAPVINNDLVVPVINNPRAAVIIFHKNVHTYPTEWIRECIASIKCQTYKKFDVFEIDYGGTGQQIYEGSHFSSFVLANHALAHNYLLDKVFNLDYDCAFNVNIDDRYSPDRFEKQISCIEGGYDIISSNYYNMDESGNVTKAMEMSGLDIDLEQLKNHNIIAHPAVCYSRNFWTTCKKLDPAEIPFDDFLMWQRNHPTGKYKFLILPDYLLYYRIHEKKVSAEK